jgi:hypothetical protein
MHTLMSLVPSMPGDDEFSLNLGTNSKIHKPDFFCGFCVGMTDKPKPFTTAAAGIVCVCGYIYACTSARSLNTFKEEIHLKLLKWVMCQTPSTVDDINDDNSVCVCVLKCIIKEFYDMHCV